MTRSFMFCLTYIAADLPYVKHETPCCQHSTHLKYYNMNHRMRRQVTFFKGKEQSVFHPGPEVTSG